VNRTPVNSSAIVSVGYDRDGMMLEIEITGGAVYQYFDVPEPVYREFMSADSLGKYYNTNIRNSYRYAQL
jgi:uncharacterized protein